VAAAEEKNSKVKELLSKFGLEDNGTARNLCRKLTQLFTAIKVHDDQLEQLASLVELELPHASDELTDII
jgi:hypothetical protein